MALTGAASAQDQSRANVYFGYSYVNAPNGFNTSGRGGLNGWNGSLEFKPTHWLGVVADFGGSYGSLSNASLCAVPFSSGCQVGTVNRNVYTQLFGPRVSVGKGRVRPYVQALFGAGEIHGSGFNLSNRDTSFADEIGAGVDFGIVKHVAWRVEGDFLQTRFFSNATSTQNNAKFTTGLVVRF
jgi:opacity protein-like surface antigen